ncbi:MAG: hypothetical protein J5789_09150 [Oscillospiraceae bacterium]|nr:hypothetical protein [Oscillospiraceae bacterium]
MKDFINWIADLFKTYTAALPTSVVAIILVIVGLKVGKTIIKLLGLALIVLAVVFYVMKV